MDDHHAVCKHLFNLDNENLLLLGGELGLHYPHMKRMAYLMGDMVAAWLNCEDNVRKLCPPSWDNLIRALENIKQHGLAQVITSEQEKGSHA